MRFPTKAIALAGKAVNAVKKHSDQILMVVGAVTSVVAVVEAVKQTPKAIDILEEHKQRVETCKKALEKHDERYGEKEYKQELGLIYLDTGKGLAKTFVMPVVMEATSLLCFFGAHKIMNNRNRILSAALATATDAYNSYRNKVIEAIGAEEEEKIRLGLTEEKVSKEITDEKGKTKSITEKHSNVIKNPAHLGPYDILWGSGDYGYDQDPERREWFVKDVEKAVNMTVYGDYGDGKEHKNKQDAMSFAEVIKYFKEAKEAYTPYNMSCGYDQNNADHRCIISMRDVEIPDPEMPGFYHDYTVLSFNIGGKITV